MIVNIQFTFSHIQNQFLILTLGIQMHQKKDYLHMYLLQPLLVIMHKNAFVISKLIFNEILELFWKNNSLPTELIMRLSKKIGRQRQYTIRFKKRKKERNPVKLNHVEESLHWRTVPPHIWTPSSEVTAKSSISFIPPYSRCWWNVESLRYKNRKTHYLYLSSSNELDP